MKRLKVKGRTVEDAIEEAKKKYGFKDGEYEYRILDKGFRGIFGLLAKDAVVEISLKKEYFSRRIKEFIGEILKHVGRIDKIRVKSNGRTYFVDLDGEDVGKLIGKHGKTLGALQHIVTIFANRLSDVKLKVVIDAGAYRERRKKQLESIAGEAIRRALEEKGKVVLDPMFPFERRIIHEMVKKHKNLTSYSIGVEPYRRVVIEYVRNRVESRR